MATVLSKADLKKRDKLAAHPTAIAELRTALATDFDTPAQRQINAMFDREDCKAQDQADWDMNESAERGQR